MSLKNTFPAKVSSFLSHHGQTAHLTRMLAQQQRLLHKVREILPEPVRQHCLHARIDGTRLILLTDSPVWNARLRFLSATLLRQLHSWAPNLKTVQVKVAIHTPDKNNNSRKASLSATAAESILDTASTIDDPQLRAALERLGRHGFA